MDSTEHARSPDTDGDAAQHPSSDVASVCVDSHGVILSSSDTAAAALESLVSQWCGRKLTNFVTIRDRESQKPILTFLEFIAASKPPLPIDRFELCCPSGRRLPVIDVTTSAAESPELQIIVSFATVAASTIEYSDEPAMLEAMAHLAQVGGWELNCETGKLRWTAETFRIHELSVGSTPPVDEALEYYAPEEREVIQEALAKATRFGEPFELEVPFTTARGNLRYVRTRCHPVSKQGRVVKLLGSFQDITDSKQVEIELSESEMRYRDIFENNTAIKLILHPDTGQIVEANRAAVEFYGYSLKDLYQLRITDINVGPDEETRNKLQEVKQGSVGEFEFRHRLASGEVRDVKVHTGTVRLNQQTLIHSIVFDITERKRADVSLQRMQLI